MKKIRINAKSIPLLEELNPKIDAGFKNIEIQLIHKYVSENEYIETKEAIENKNIDISVVHTPLLHNPDFEIALDHLLISDVDDIFEDTCKYAEFVAKIEKHNIKVVIHDDFSKEEWSETNLLNEKIGSLVRNILIKYPHVYLVIENSCSTAQRGFKTIKDMEDVSCTVKVLNEFIDNRAMSLIDTCHMMMTWEAWKRISYEDLTNWDTAFRDASKYSSIGLIHLNNMHDNGLDQDHGIPFDYNNVSDMNKLKEIMDSYEKYASCEITIEVYEADYLSFPKNIVMTRKSLENLGYVLDLG